MSRAAVRAAGRKQQKEHQPRLVRRDYAERVTTARRGLTAMVAAQWGVSAWEYEQRVRSHLARLLASSRIAVRVPASAAELHARERAGRRE